MDEGTLILFLGDVLGSDSFDTVMAPLTTSNIWKTLMNSLIYGGVKISHSTIKLNRKYVFHIPLCRFVDGELERIEIGELLDDLIKQLSDNGFESLYMSKVRSLYKSRMYDEVLITLFATQSQSPEEIFMKWFEGNNDVLMQEAFAYECNDELTINPL